MGGGKNGSEVLARIFTFLVKDIETSVILMQYLLDKGFLVNSICLTHNRRSRNIY